MCASSSPAIPVAAVARAQEQLPQLPGSVFSFSLSLPPSHPTQWHTTGHVWFSDVVLFAMDIIEYFRLFQSCVFFLYSDRINLLSICA